jgi:hypothetical protein
MVHKGDAGMQSPVDGVFISSAVTANDLETLAAHEIDIVIVAARTMCPSYRGPDTRARMRAAAGPPPPIAPSKVLDKTGLPALELNVHSKLTEAEADFFFDTLVWPRWVNSPRAHHAAVRDGVTWGVDGERVPRPVYVYLDMIDTAEQSLRGLAIPIARFICNVRLSHHPGRVLVHCAQGISRSVSLVAAYMMFAPALLAHAQRGPVGPAKEPLPVLPASEAETAAEAAEGTAPLPVSSPDVAKASPLVSVDVKPHGDMPFPAVKRAELAGLGALVPSLELVVTTIRAVRSCARPNPGFAAQLGFIRTQLSK